MKKNMRILLLLVVAAVIVPAFYVYRQAGTPESSIITGERNRLAESLDKSRMERDPAYAFELENKLRLLDYRLAVSYNNRENKPDEAIKILEKLIRDEEAKSKSGVRRSRSYRDEAAYYEVLHAAYLLKNDQAGAEKALQRRSELKNESNVARKKEQLEEGKSVGMDGE